MKKGKDVPTIRSSAAEYLTYVASVGDQQDSIEMRYDKNSATTRRFYATVQNKMHYAVHGHTAAELIVERADHTKEHMGLTTWADAPEGKIKKSDVTVAKNYLSQGEMKQLNRMVTAYLDFAENMTLRHIPLTMQKMPGITAEHRKRTIPINLSDAIHYNFSQLQ